MWIRVVWMQPEKLCCSESKDKLLISRRCRRLCGDVCILLTLLHILMVVKLGERWLLFLWWLKKDSYGRTIWESWQKALSTLQLRAHRLGVRCSHQPNTFLLSCGMKDMGFTCRSTTNLVCQPEPLPSEKCIKVLLMICSKSLKVFYDL